MCTEIRTVPGKFEGESCIARIAYEWLLDGMADVLGSTEDETPDVFYGPFTMLDSYMVNLCPTCVIDLSQANRILLYESNDGFVSVDIE